MLNEGRRLKQRGVDVVIGYVEPHDRPETTAQIGDLEIVPPRLTSYHGITLKEMDVAAVIARKPTVALVDELAHTNAPDSKNRKRYEDVEDLMRAGISVISTVNIQHLESLYNFVEESTGVRVKERVPDEILTKADQIVNIDLPAEDLQERLQAGKIYPKERIEGGARQFFHGEESDAPARDDAHRNRQLPGPPAAGKQRPRERTSAPSARSWWRSQPGARTPAGSCARRPGSPRNSMRSGMQSMSARPRNPPCGSTPPPNAGSRTRSRRRRKWAAWSFR